jgi:hypothetical protein
MQIQVKYDNNMKTSFLTTNWIQTKQTRINPKEKTFNSIKRNNVAKQCVLINNLDMMEL